MYRDIRRGRDILLVGLVVLIKKGGIVVLDLGHIERSSIRRGAERESIKMIRGGRMSLENIRRDTDLIIK